MASPSGEVSSHVDSDSVHFIDAQICEASTSPGTNAGTDAACEVSTSDEPTLPLMADIMSGPNAPLSKGFLMAQSAHHPNR